MPHRSRTCFWSAVAARNLAHPLRPKEVLERPGSVVPIESSDFRSTAGLSKISALETHSVDHSAGLEVSESDRLARETLLEETSEVQSGQRLFRCCCLSGPARNRHPTNFLGGSFEEPARAGRLMLQNLLVGDIVERRQQQQVRNYGCIPSDGPAADLVWRLATPAREPHSFNRCWPIPSSPAIRHPHSHFRALSRAPSAVRPPVFGSGGSRRCRPRCLHRRPLPRRNPRRRCA